MSTPNPTGSYTSEEQRKFNEFLLELLDVGCTKGFRNFSTHLRGREEMTVKIVNEPSVPVVLTSQVASPGFSLNQSILRENLPRSRQSMLLSGRWQRRLSGYGLVNVESPASLLPRSTSGQIRNRRFIDSLPSGIATLPPALRMGTRPTTQTPFVHPTLKKFTEGPPP